MSCRRGPAALFSTSSSASHSSSPSSSSSLSPSSLEQLNRTTVRLYRILLRQCGRVGVGGGTTTVGGGDPPSSASRPPMLLLQPPIDPRDYGLATLRPLDHVYAANHRYYDDDGGRWIGAPAPGAGVGGGTGRTTSSNAGSGSGSMVDELNVYRSVTSFLDGCMARDLGGGGPGHRGRTATMRTPGGGRGGASSSTGAGLDVLVSSSDLRSVVRRSFRVSPHQLQLQQLGSHGSSSPSPSSDSDDDSSGPALSQLSKEDVVGMQRRAVDAVRVMNAQLSLGETTSVGPVDSRYGCLRVVATSSCIGKVVAPPSSSSSSTTSSPSGGTRYRFAYRIRVENLNLNDPNDDDGDDASASASASERRRPEVVRLLGRTWKIRSGEGEGGDDDGDGTGTGKGTVQNVVAPRTGAVGELPVIRPGEVFEYMSGCELDSPTGVMTGRFHMALLDDGGDDIDYDYSDAALATGKRVGDDDVEAFRYGPDRLFELEVGPFGLIAR